MSDAEFYGRQIQVMSEALGIKPPPPERTRPMTARFKFLTGDVNWPDYGGKFYRRVAKGAGPTDGRFHVMEVMNWNEHESEPECTYNVSLSEVDLDAATAKMLDEALRSCYGEADALSVEADDNAHLIKLECLYSYGYKAPLWDASGNNLKKLMAEARAESAALDDHEKHEEAMRRPVNAIGSTAREFMAGDISSAMNRVPEVKAAGAVLARCKLKKIPSDDPLAYMTGYMAAIGGGGLDVETEGRNQLADAYLEGYRAAVDVRAGRAEKPDWYSAL